jgi:hypothetical protein
MNDKLLASIEREVLAWPGVSKHTPRGDQGHSGFRIPPATVYKVDQGRSCIPRTPA